ncbi:glycoside hydrolase family 3 C-terminal domain-containing protein, partial [Streptomyces albidoflavus]
MATMRTEPDAGPAASWSLVVPLKPLVLAKSRLAPALDGATRARLALAPGPWGGQAVADVLLGTSEPTGRLPVSVPRSAA